MSTGEHLEEEALMAWTDGEICGADAVSIRTHVESCGRCAAAVDEYVRVGARLKDWAVEPASFEAPRRPARTWRRFRWVAAACVAAAMIAVPAWWTTGRRTPGQPAGLSANVLLPGAVQAAGIQTASAARVTVTMFVDWQCPACARSYPTYFQLMQEYEASVPGQVALLIKDFPLDPKCNAAVQRAVHAAACDAAAAVRMARARGRAEDMIAFLIGHVRPTLQPAAIRAAAVDVLGDIDFDAAYERELPGIRDDVADGIARHVQFTPSFFVNDVPLASNGQGLATRGELHAAIDAQLRRR